MKTQNRRILFLIRSGMAVLFGLGLALLLNVQAVAQAQFDVLKTKTDTFRNVTVTGSNQTDIFITHSKGMGNVKIKDLDADTLWKLGLGPEPAPLATASAAATKPSTASVPAAGDVAVSGPDAEALAALPPELQDKIQAAMAFEQGMSDVSISAINPVFIGSAIAVVLFIYLFGAYCLKLIVEKTGERAGLLIWLPVLQLFPMARGARMSGWWFGGPILLILLSVAAGISTQASSIGGQVGLVSMLAMLAGCAVLSLSFIVWNFRIVDARGKSVWVAIALLLPGVSLIAFLYLAFSSGVEAEDNNSRLSGRNAPPVLLEA